MSTKDQQHRYLRGDWMGSLYGISGQRMEWTLGIRADHSYTSIRRWDEADPSHESGQWLFDEENEILTLISDGDEEGRSWRVLDVTSCERANTMLVLRRLIVGSRNLPYLLYRVHHNPFGTNQDEQ